MRIFLRHFRRSSRKPCRAGGFTLIELLVVVALIVLITSAMLVRQARFDSSTLLRSLSYSIALSVRQAQVYGTSILGVKSGTTNVFASAYGIYFNGSNTYTVFADLDNNGTYNAGDLVVGSPYVIGNGYKISKMCATLSSGAQNCAPSYISIYFKRPNPDAFFSDGVDTNITGAYIQISANNDSSNTRSISVTSTGQISVGASGT